MPAITIPRLNLQKQISTFVALTVIMFLAAGVYCYFQYVKLAETRQAIVLEQGLINEITTAGNASKDQYLVLKKSFEKDFSGLKSTMQSVFPDSEMFTELTRNLDLFMDKYNNSSVNPIFMSDIKFSKPRIASNVDYSALPFNLSLSTTNDNFIKFLRYIENSGSLSDGSRLMDVNSISIDFPGDQSSGDATAVPQLNVSFGLNAYFQKPLESAATGAAAAQTAVANPGA